MTRLPDFGPRGEGWVVIQGLLLVAIGLTGALGPGWAGELRLVAALVGVILMLAGLLLVLLGARDLAASRALTPLPHPRDDASLLQTGVYRIVRHPVYGGVSIVAFGWGLLTASIAALALAVVLFAFFELKSRREEAWLIQRFPEYQAYRARTPRLIPWLGARRD